MNNSESKGGTKTLRLTASENEHLEKIMLELGEKTASKTIPLLFECYDNYKTMKKEYEEMKKKNDLMKRYISFFQNKINSIFRLFDIFLKTGIEDINEPLLWKIQEKN